MQVKLIAHRGYAARYPENTLIGIEAAIKAGAEFVEVDVQLAADGTPMLFHDRTLDRMCGVNGAIADYSPQQLARLEASEPGRFGDAFAGTPIATLAALAGLIRQHPWVHFFIELKCESIERFDSAMVLERTQQGLTGLEEMCTLISFSVEAIGLAKARGLSTGLILENWTQGQSMGKKGSGLGKKGDSLLSSERKSETVPFFRDSRPDPISCLNHFSALPAPLTVPSSEYNTVCSS